MVNSNHQTPRAQPVSMAKAPLQNVLNSEYAVYSWHASHEIRDFQLFKHDFMIKHQVVDKIETKRMFVYHSFLIVYSDKEEFGWFRCVTFPLMYGIRSQADSKGILLFYVQQGKEYR